MTIELGTEIMSLQAAAGTGLALRTESVRRNGGALAHPLRWYKALTKNEIESLCITSGSKPRRYFFDCDELPRQPGYLTGLYNVLPLHRSRQSKQLGHSGQLEQPQPSHLMTGFFDDICNPASAGFFNVPSTKLNNQKIPIQDRDFSCTNQS